MIVILIIFSVIVLIRLSLPHVARHYVNKRLTEMKGYHGRVEHVRINLVKGVYKIGHISIYKGDAMAQAEMPFFSAASVELVIQWRALFRKSVVGKIIMEQAKLELMAEKADDKEANNFNLKAALQKLIPFNINFEVNNGSIHYTGHTAKSKIELVMKDVFVVASNVSNMPGTTELLPAHININAVMYEGTMALTLKLNPLADHLTFDLNTEVKNINMALLNDLFQAYAKIDVNKGRFGMYTEVAARNGEFSGYVKPIIRELDILGAEDRDDNFFRKLWEGFVAGVFQVLKNKREDQIATKIQIAGKFDNPHVNVVSAVLAVLKNAFIRAIQPSIDDVINLGSVREFAHRSKGFIKNIFARKES